MNQKLESDNKRGDQTFSEHCQGALEHLMNTDVCVRNKKKSNFPSLDLQKHPSNCSSGYICFKFVIF